MYLRILSIVLMVVGLAACGGSKVEPLQNIPFAEVTDRAEAFYQTYWQDVLEGNYLTEADLPVSGTANYRGFIAIGGPAVATGDEHPVEIGELNIHVSFSDGDMEGTAGNFHLYDGGLKTATEAELVGQINGDGTFLGSIGGQHSSNDGTDVWPFDVNIGGGFLGDDAAAIAGSGTGTITVEGEDQGAGVSFAAEQ